MRTFNFHFDLNRTVLMSDAAGGRSMENTVNYLLSECCWGVKSPTSNQWHCVSSHPSLTPPPELGTDGMTYKKYVDLLHPYKSLASTDSFEENKVFNKLEKKKRTALQSAFTGTNGPGLKLRSSFEFVMQKLHFPQGSAREAAIKAASSMESCGLKEAWSEGRYYLLPSFLAFLFHVSELKQQTSAKYNLIFRTFGEDLPNVAKELAFLHKGCHPLFPGRKLSSNMRMSDTFGTFYRDENGTVLAVGTLDKVPFAKTNTESTPEEFYSNKSADIKVHRGFPAINNAINGLLQSTSVIGLRDYWEWWNAHAEQADYGKMLLIDLNDEDVCSVFFDDHIEKDHAHIVDVRSVLTGEVINFETSNGRFLYRVEPYYAITEDNYFINMVSNIMEKPL